MPARLVIALVLLLLSAAEGTAADGKIPVPFVDYPRPAKTALLGTDPESGTNQVLYEESSALLIGESRYPSMRNDDLPAVPDEFTRLSAALRDHGFRVEGYLNLTAAEIRTVVGRFIATSGFKRNARIVLYFAGHGLTREDAMETDPMATSPASPRTLGYWLPVDVTAPDATDWYLGAIRLSELVEWADTFEAKHVLTVLDSCFSGSIFEGTRSPLPATKAKQPQWVVFRKPLQSRVREFITAGTAQQRVPKTSSVADTFIKALRNELKPELADYNEDGYLTGSELYSVVKRIAELDTQTTPQWGWSRSPGMRDGDIVFKLPTPLPLVVAQNTPLPLVSVGAPAAAVPPEKVSRSIAALCPPSCGETTAVVAELSLAVPPLTTALAPTLQCASTGGTVKYVSPARADPDGRRVTGKVAVWAGNADCTLSYEPSRYKLNAANATPPLVLTAQGAGQTKLRPDVVAMGVPQPSAIGPQAAGEIDVASRPPVFNSGVLGNQVAQLSVKPFTLDMARQQKVTLAAYVTPFSDRYPRLRLGSSEILVAAAAKPFDFRIRLEAENTQERRAARSELAKILPLLGAQDVDAVIRALPNSSYRVALGVSEALGQVSGQWASSDPARSRKALELLPKLMNGDETLKAAVKRALDKMS